MESEWLTDEVKNHDVAIDVHSVLAGNHESTVWFSVSRSVVGATFHAVLLRAERRPIVLAEEEISNPGSRWELRSSGLWVDHNCEVPLDHWSYGLEAFALALEDADQLINEGVGDRVPLGWELDFDAAGGPVALEFADGYSQRGRVHGVILTSDPQALFEGEAVRHHWWGLRSDTPRSMQLDNFDLTVDGSVRVRVGSQVWQVDLAGRSRIIGSVG